MKIAIIGHKRIPTREGGIEKGVEMHALRMVARGNEVHVFNRGNSTRFGQDFHKVNNYKGIIIHTIPTTNGIAEVPIYSFLATLQAIFLGVDVISYRASGSCVMVPLAKLFGIRTVASIHGIDSQRAKWGKFASKYLEFGERMAAKKADICLVLSSAMQQYFKQKYNCNAVRFVNGVNKPTFSELNRMSNQYGLVRGEYFLSLGRIAPEKGIHYLINAFKNVKTNKKLVIAGGNASNGDYYDDLVKLAAGDSRIIFTGFADRQDSSELFSNAYAFVLPSDLEGMANALLEAMAYGKCCLVSSIPENTEVVKNQAFVFKRGNVQDLTCKLQYLQDHPSEVQRISMKSSEFILSKYSWDTVVDQMLDLYRGIIKPYDEYYGE